MSKVRALHNRRAADAWRHLHSLGYVVDPMTGDAEPEPEHPDVTRIRRENLRLTERNPEPTLSPESMGRVRDDLAAGRFNRQRHAIHQAEDALHESGFPGPGGSAA